MVVSIVISKLQDGHNQLSAVRRDRSGNSSQQYGSLTHTCAALLGLGLPNAAVNFYATVLIPLLDTNHTLAFPAIDIPKSRLRKHGFIFRERAA